MSEREQQIVALIRRWVEVDDSENPDKAVYLDAKSVVEAARRIAALPQQITAETVRRVRVATTAVLQSNQGFGGEMGAEQMQALDEAIAQHANQGVSHEG